MCPNVIIKIYISSESENYIFKDQLVPENQMIKHYQTDLITHHTLSLQDIVS